MNKANTPLLELNSVTKHFGGVVAVDGVSFKVYPGEIVGLIGPNGAGKTTLFNLITGIFPLTQGEILFQGQRINNLKPNVIAQLGITRTFQNLQMFANMQVIENVMVGAHNRGTTSLMQAAFSLPGVRQEEARIKDKALEYLREVGLEKQAYAMADNLPFGQQRLVEIARAMASEPKFVILDEPAAGLNSSETFGLIQLIRKMRSDDKTIMLVEHDMETVMTLADRIVVLDFGAKIAEGTPYEIQANAKVIKAYLGEED